MTQDKIIVHTLKGTRSSRVTWLLEELGIDYSLSVCKFKNNRAPKELTKVHELGKVPVVEIYPGGDTTAEPIVLAESGYIFDYLVSHYDSKKKLTPSNPKDAELARYYFYYAEGSITPHIITLFVYSKVVQIMPMGLSFVFGKILGLIQNAYSLPELIKHLHFLENRLKNRGTLYFTGDKIGAVDILFSFPLYECIFKNLMSGYLTFDLNDFPHLQKWAKLIEENPTRLQAEKNEAAKLLQSEPHM